MRTEVKIVAILAFVLIVVGVWWFMFHSPQGKEVATNEPTNSSPSNVVVTEPKPSGVKTPSSITPSGSAASRPTSAAASTPSGAAMASAEKKPATADGGNWWERAATPTAASAPTRVTAVTPAAGATSKPSLADTGSSHSYKVKTGDTYWSIAKAEYGDGNLHGLIETANPKVPSNRLAANMTITIPAKPGAAVAAAPGAAAPAATGSETSSLAAEGTTGTDPVTGKRYYIVKKGDNGLWAIAQNTLGDGKLWTKIKAANEGLQETNLRPGQKLWLPQVAGAEVKPAAAKPTAGATGSMVTIPGLTPATPAEAVKSTAVSPPASPAKPAANVPSGTGAPSSTNLPGGKTFD